MPATPTKTRSASVKEKKKIQTPVLLENMPQNKGGGDKSTSFEEDSLTSIKSLLMDMDKRFTKNFQDLRKDLTSQISVLENKFDGLYNSLKKDIDVVRTDFDTEVGDLKVTVKALEEGMDYQANKVEELEHNQAAEFDARESKLQTLMEESRAEMEKKCKELESQLLRLQKHSRKYNLLFYGVPGGRKGEDVYRTLRLHLEKDLKMDETTVDRMMFHNVHRLYSDNPSKAPIIAKFVFYEDREDVFTRVKNLPPGMRILSDLPVSMKKERNRLAGKAYRLRKPENGDPPLYTRIREEDMNLILETRSTRDDPWVKNEIVKF